MTRISKTLEKFNFSENEAKVYVAMLKLGDASVGDIAKVANLNRITTHHIATRLEERGFATRFGPDNKKKIKAIHPEALKKKLEGSLAQFTDLLPELVAITREDSVGKKPVVRMYYGVEGFKSAAEELLQKPNNMIRHIGSLKEAHKFIGVDYDKEYFIPKRVAKNINYRSLSYKDEERPVLRTSNTDDLRQVRHLPEKYILKNNTFVIPGKVVIVTTAQELMTVVVESEDISNSEIQKFDLIWDLLGTQASSSH